MILRNITSQLYTYLKTLLAVLLILFQLFILFFIIINVNYYAKYFYFLVHAIGFFVILIILGSNRNYSYKLSWVIFLFVFPTSAVIFYLLFGSKRYIKQKIKNEANARQELGIVPYRDDKLVNSITDLELKSQLDLLYTKGYFNSYKNTDAQYFELGDTFFEDLILKLQDAQKFILLEYYIINDGVLYSKIHDILLAKASEGIEIHLMYDAVGSLTTVPKKRLDILKKAGVKIYSFNNSITSLYTYVNYRSHRKITVIDGKYAYTGGNNIADEYINKVVRFGHWKDMGIRLEGEGVDYFTKLFFSAIASEFNYIVELDKYINLHSVFSDYIVTPISDGATNPKNPAKFNYMKIISSAQKYVYITTPYLIIDDEMTAAITLAAQSGVDIRIILPGIADKKFVYNVSLAHINILLANGVKVFTYTPGFVHGKTILSDDKVSVVGSINFDSRSLEWNYECGVHVYSPQFAESLKKDYQKMFDVSLQITYEDLLKRNAFSRIFNGVLKILGPLL